MLTFRTGAAGAPSAAAAMAAHLLEHTLPAEQMRLAEYYAQTHGTDAALALGMGCVPSPRADLHPALGEALGIAPGRFLNEVELANVLGGRRADGGELPGYQRDVRRYKGDAAKGTADRVRISYMDLCLSAPKSASVAWAFAQTDAERNSILQAHRNARDAVLRYIEAEIGKAGFGHGGREGEERGRIAWIVCDHFTARPTVEITRADPVTGVVDTELHTVRAGSRVAGDPQLHSHCIVPNMMVTESGRLVAINRDLLKGRIHEFGAVYQALLAKELHAIGIHSTICERTLAAKLTAIPEHVCDEFSKRARDAEGAARAEAAKRGLSWDAMTDDQRVAFLKGGAGAARQGKADDLAAFAEWRAQAERVGWRHESAIAHGPAAPERAVAERREEAYGISLPLFDAELTKRAVVLGSDARLAAARALIVAGIDSTDDVGAVVGIMTERGVRQDGRLTRIIARDVEGGRQKLTTELHRDQERELIALARGAAADRSLSLAPAEIARAVAASGLRFDGEHGRAQRAAIEALGTDGGLGVSIGAAGTGKTSRVLPPLVAAWKARGFEVWGTAQAWRQANALHEGGIDRFHCRAMQPFLDSVQEGSTKLGPRSVVVLDELGQIGTRQLLHLLRLREQHGFKIAALGDDRQCTSVEAGPVIDLLRQALGEARISQILTTIRQLSEEERFVTGLFRAGKVGEAVAIKRQDGTAELAEGGYRQAVARAAAAYRQARTEHPGMSVTMSAPTNADAREISRAVRMERRALGEVGQDRVTIAATDKRGDAYSLTLAEGDNVRLYARTRAVFTDAQGRRKSANIGDNGSVLRVVEILPTEGLRLANDSGKVGFVSWNALRDDGTGRIALAYGDCATIDSSQGSTSDIHILALPAGSKAVSGFKAYVGASRHRVRFLLVGSMGAELREAVTRQPMGLPEPGTPAERATAAWDNLVRNLSKAEAKESALAFLADVAGERVRAVASLQAGLRRHEARAAAGLRSTTLRAAFDQRQARKVVRAVAQRLGEAMRARAPVVKQLAAMVPPRSVEKAPAAAPVAQPPRTMRRVRLSEVEAQQQFLDAMRAAGLKPHGLPIMDGQRHYCPVEGNKGRRQSGAYVGHYDDGVPNGLIWNYKTGAKARWKASGEFVPMQPAEIAALAAKAEASRAAAAQERAAREMAGAGRAQAILDASRPADLSHPYLAAKGVAPHGIRQDQAGQLVIPLRDADGRLWNAQTISPDGTKLYLKGARKLGTFYLIGDLKPGAPVIVAEGFATAATVHQATGQAVAVALDTSNLSAVATALRERDPSRPIFLAADNDHHLPRRPVPLPNAGLVKAQAAAAEVGGRVLAPTFEPHERGTDWNDFAAKHGLAATRDALRAAWQQAEAPRVTALEERPQARSRQGLRM